jgi:hypothetical protein
MEIQTTTEATEYVQIYSLLRAIPLPYQEHFYLTFSGQTPENEDDILR